MKKLFIALAFIANTYYAFSYIDDNKEDVREYVEITHGTESSERERSSSMVHCYILRNLHQIEIEFAGIGVPSVVILDNNGNICSHKYALSNYGTINIELPDRTGDYQIYIQSSIYSGMGSFTIE